MDDLTISKRFFLFSSHCNLLLCHTWLNIHYASHSNHSLTFSTEYIVAFDGYYSTSIRHEYVKSALETTALQKWKIMARNNPASDYPSDFSLVKVGWLSHGFVSVDFLSPWLISSEQIVADLFKMSTTFWPYDEWPHHSKSGEIMSYVECKFLPTVEGRYRHRNSGIAETPKGTQSHSTEEGAAVPQEHRRCAEVLLVWW